MARSACNAIHALWRRADFRQNPVRAVGRRIYWRARWACTDAPWVLPLGKDASILAPKGGAGALIYYLGFSEPDTAKFIMDFLRPGMVFWDVGAHIGEYSLLAAKRVGIEGRVEAFEPHPKLAEIVKGNVARNQLSNVTVRPTAVVDRSGTVELVLEQEPSLTHIRSDREQTPCVAVPAVTLDEFAGRDGAAHDAIPDLIKVDVEGAESMVLVGARTLLRLPPEVAPVWIMEFSPANCARFGFQAQALLSAFRGFGYRTYWLTPTGLAATGAGDGPYEEAGDCNFVATKRELQP